MNGGLAGLVLSVVTAATALNLFLTLRLAARMRASEDRPGPLTVPIGARLPTIAGIDWTGELTVVVFLAAGCPACRGKAGELARLVPGMDRSGVRLLLVGMGDIRTLVAGTALVERRITLDPDAVAALNPRGAAPAYIFVDGGGSALASDYLGDENWRTFAAEMLAAGS